jgi:5-methylcytosine-specific restriction endonuclease McrA
LLRQLQRRDRGCRFADCGRSRGLHAHHVVHWAHGGRTDLENLVLLCPRHHRKVHEERWRLLLDARGRTRTIRPDGRPLKAPPFPMRPELREVLSFPRRARAPAL